MKLSAVLLLLLLASPEMRYFRYQRPIQVSAAGQTCAALDPALDRNKHTVSAWIVQLDAQSNSGVFLKSAAQTAARIRESRSPLQTTPQRRIQRQSESN